MHRHAIPQNSSLKSLATPLSTQHELEVLELYLQLLIEIKTHLFRETTLDEDLDIMRQLNETQNADWQMKMAMVYRIQRKIICESQFTIIQKAIRVLQGKESVLQETEPESVARANAEV